METTDLRQFLRGLCDESCWDYAVFWKLRHQIPAVLSWEDGYCNQPRPRTPTEDSPDIIYFDGSSDMSFFDDETGLIYGTAGQYPIELLMADMSSLQHTLGEGLVGRVACTYNYHWISSEDISASQFNYDNPAEFQEEWMPHLLAGVKTVLLVSMHPDGVLQLGSSVKVAEDASVVDHIRERFYARQVLSGCATPPTPEEDHPLQSSPSSDDLDEPSCITNTVREPWLREECEGISNKEANESYSPMFGSLQDIFEGLEDSDDLISAIGLSGVPVPLSEPPLESSQSEIAQREQFSVSYLRSNLPGLPNKMVDSYVTSNIITGPCGDEEEDAEFTPYETLSSIFSTPMDRDLFESLGPSFQSQTSEFPGYEALSIDIRDFTNGIEPYGWGFGDCDAKVKEEDLLEAVVATFFDGLDQTSPNGSETITSSAVPVVQSDPTPSSKSPSDSKEIFVGGGDSSVLWSNIEAAFAARNGNSSSKHSNSAASKSVVSCLTDNEQPKEGQKHQLSGSKRKGRSGDNQKPRPRDRQLIQDRVKELRELVPNSSKCSIDALLDRTVKHMLFLRTVTNQAEKLRKCVPPKESKPKIWKTLGIDEEDCEKKRGWAFDFGGEFQVFPIVVEDLEYPGQMLIEMMCDEQGLFLEIAQVIRRLELTILKGVMETRSDSTWARFVVEASKGFQRTEIFWPLMQVLQHRGKPVSGTA